MATSQLKTVNINSLPAGKAMGKIKAQNVDFGHKQATLVTVSPGGAWSKDLKAIHGTESCQKSHFGFVISGAMAVRMDDGSEARMGPNDIFFVPEGHDAWCAGDEPAVFLEFA